MSIRRVNSTGRKKILRKDVRIFVHSDPDGGLSFDATLNLANYSLPDNAKVFVEAYRQTSFMRFPFGTVTAPQPPHGLSRRLTEFTNSNGLLWRVKVTATESRVGVLLAKGDRIPASDDEEQPDNRIALLPPAPAELRQEIWRVDLDGADGPLLLVNRHVGDWKAVASSPLFRSLVYPAAMRQVLWHVYKVEEMRTMDDISDDWRCRWLTFAAHLPGVGAPPLDSEDDEMWKDWISEAIASFTRQHQMLDHYTEFLAAEQGT